MLGYMNFTISSMAIKAMFWRVLLVITVSSFGGYWFNYQLVRERTISDIERYLQERIGRESIPFSIAEKNLKLLAQRFVELSESYPGDIDHKFKSLAPKAPDGAYRSIHREADKVQVLIPKNTEVSDRVKKNLVISERLLAQFGPVLKPHFLNMWMVGKEDYGICFWPSEPGLLHKVPADVSLLTNEYASVGLPENNPKGKPVWAGPYLDLMSDDWMISLNHPVFINGEYHLSFGMDIILEDFNDRATSNSMQGTYNIIFNEDGRLIVHPKYMDKIKESNGQFFIGKTGDSTLQNIYNRTLRHSGEVIYDKETKHFLGVGQIPNMDWYFVLVFPESNLQAISLKTALFVAIMGLLSLIIEMLMLYQVLGKYVAKPISKLVHAANKIANGNFQSRVEDHEENEIGQLGRSFNEMARNIEERDNLLSDHAQRLEQKVIDRTSELDLQRTRAVEASKMATLGEISAGIAHEINNPLQSLSLTVSRLQKEASRLEHDEAENFDKYLERMGSTIDRITKVIKGLRSFSRNSEGDLPEPTRLKSIIDNTFVLCKDTIALRNIQIIHDQIPEVNILCRETDIIQTLVNLIQNSIDALEYQELKEIRLSYNKSGEELQIIVEDSGPGISPELVDKIMNPFFTTKEYGKGTGLGLFISSGLVHANGGKLYLDSSSQKTRFIISLQLLPPSSQS
jgi:two-component system, NtrC family, sensor kinase